VALGFTEMNQLEINFFFLFNFIKWDSRKILRDLIFYALMYALRPNGIYDLELVKYLFWL
jgi:hypothetical protein